jgi:hypothetical protein
VTPRLAVISWKLERMAWDAQLEVERVVLFSRGYLSQER